MIKSLIFRFLEAFAAPSHIEKKPKDTEAIDILKPSIKLTAPTIMQKIEASKPLQAAMIQFTEDRLKENASKKIPIALDLALRPPSEWVSRHVKS